MAVCITAQSLRFTMRVDWPKVLYTPSLQVHLGFDVILSLVSLSKHIEGAVSMHVHLTQIVTIVHIIFLECHEFEGVGGHSLFLILLLAEHGGLGKSLLVDLR